LDAAATDAVGALSRSRDSYPGHGDPGSAQKLIEAQITYIETLRELVANALEGDNVVTAEEKEEVLAAMKERYPDYKTSLLLPGLLAQGVDGLLRRWVVQSFLTKAAIPETICE
jgi:hypothetical protein